MRAVIWVRVCAAVALYICSRALWADLQYLLHGTYRGLAAMASAWIVMVWCAALLVTGVSLLLLMPWARRGVVGLLLVYIGYFLVGIGVRAIVLLQPALLLPTVAFTAVPILCVWYLSRQSVKDAMAARVHLTSAST